MMTSRRLRWHAWLYSAPCVCGGMVLLLLMCLIGVPLMEDRLIFHASQLGFEFVHGLVLWMLLLSLYLAVAHFLKLKVSSELTDRLTEVNTILVRSNILATMEELGVLEYSKLALHFFYFEIGPCLGYLQDMIEPGPAVARQESQPLQLLDATATCDMVDISDTAVLDPNVNTQHNAEDLMIEHASHYLNTLLSGRLRTPVTPRHLHHHLCLCQYLEYRLSNKSLAL